MVRVKLVELCKSYGAVKAVDKVTLEIEEGELFTLLGPSGCGKTTTLRLIAGFELPDHGRILFDDEDVTLKKPYERGTAMVFQNYALWPHMTVFENVAYGLRIRKLPKKEIEERVERALELVKLKGLEERYPTQLSGGQQQRVALARALVVEPRVLLLDEPLSNLDARLRIEMREEIKRLQKKLGITTIYVTHDQEEAMSISDRIAVMDKGRVLQVGTPKEIYFKPRNIFTATFIGKTTVLEGVVTEVSPPRARISGSLELEFTNATEKKLREGEKVRIVVRPEFFRSRLPEHTRCNKINGVVEMTMFIGPFLQVRLKVNSVHIVAYLPAESNISVGDEIQLYLPVERTLGFVE